VATRIVSEFGSFEDLSAATPQPRNFNPAWFKRCADLAQEFDWAEWTKPWLVPAIGSESRNSPGTTLYVCEGVHRTIVLALGLLTGTIVWRELHVVEADERPADCC
jgi:hypothetical protein